MEPDPLVGGRLALPAGGSVAGYTLEVVNQLSKWRSGKITLNETAAFQLNLRAEFEDATPLGVVSDRLGHATPSITLDVYAHVLRDQAGRAVPSNV